MIAEMIDQLGFVHHVAVPLRLEFLVNAVYYLLGARVINVSDYDRRG